MTQLGHKIFKAVQMKNLQLQAYMEHIQLKQKELLQ
jgi:hypothetical protein